MSNQYTFAPPSNRLKLTAYIFKYPRQFWMQAAGGIIYNTIIVFASIFLGRTIDAAHLLHQGEAPLSYFYQNLFAFVGATVLFQLARYFKRYYMRELVNLMRGDIRAGLLAALFAMPMQDLSKEKVGDMMSRMIGDVEQVGESVRTTITELWDTVLLMISFFVACLWFSPRITLLASIPIPFVIVFAHMMRTPLYNLSLKSRKAAANINVHLQHNVSGISLLRLFGLEEADRKRFSNLLDTQLKWSVATSSLQGGMRPLYILLSTLGVILAIGMGGEYVVSGTWTIGAFTAYLTMFTALATRTNVAGRVMNTWHGAKASWDRILVKLDDANGQSATEESTNNAIATVAESSKHFFDVRGLTFTYPFSDEPTVQDVSFTANKGEIIGITGPVGSGKSAFAAALSGLFPYDGEVLIDGFSLKDLGEKRSRKIAYMDAEHFVFSDDVHFNVSLDRVNGNMDAAIHLAALSQDINAFEHGMDTRLMERGVRVSGGQRQRIALARAWFGDSEILILDDPFSGIDVRMEQTIIENIRHEQKRSGQLVLLFSHRLAAFESADKIIVMDKGHIRQIGTHDELMKAQGIYHEIYAAQAYLREGSDNE